MAEDCACHLYCQYCQEVTLRFEQPYCHLSSSSTLWLMILRLQISFQQHSITNAEISWHFGPHLTFLQGLDKLLSPPASKLITKMLNSSPRTSAAQIRILENPWCKHHHLCLHREHVIWRYFIWHWTLSFIDCLNIQWSRIYYCLIFSHECLQGFLIQAVLICLYQRFWNCPRWPYLVLPNITHVAACWRILFPNNAVSSIILEEVFYFVVVH